MLPRRGFDICLVTRIFVVVIVSRVTFYLVVPVVTSFIFVIRVKIKTDCCCAHTCFLREVKTAEHFCGNFIIQQYDRSCNLLKMSLFYGGMVKWSYKLCVFAPGVRRKNFMLKQFSHVVII